MTHQRLGTVAAMTALAVASGCADGTDVEGTSGRVEVTMQRAAFSLASAADVTVYLSKSSTQGKVDPALVDALFVTVTSIGFLPVETMDGDPMNGDPEDAMWSWLEFPEPVTLDLMALPTEGESPIVIAAGEIEVGDYRKVRMIVGGATIVFNEEISVGQSVYTVGDEHAVTVPSGAQSGLKTDAAFSVVADDVGDPTDVNLLFDPDATFKNVVATGSGKINLAPVLKAR